MQFQFDVIILGAGAAGLMCAIEAGKRGRRVAVLERAERIGKKILISGGGRCNFTNLHCRPESFLSANPHFAKSAFARYTPADFIALVEKHGIAYHEKTLGQLFCDGPAQQIVTMLEEECRAARVRIQTNVNVEQVSKEDGFLLRAGDDEFQAESLVVATGGLSIPKMGATGFGYDLARQFGLKIIEPRAALVPFTFNQNDAAHFCDLAGVSAEVIASIGAQSFREKMLITHRGLSGPAILQISSYWKPGQPVSLNLAPEHELTAALRDPKKHGATCLRQKLLSAARCHTALPIAGSTFIRRRAGATTRSMIWNGSPTTGRLLRQEQRATRKLKSPRVAWTRMSYRPRPWKAEKCRAYFSSGK